MSDIVPTEPVVQQAVPVGMQQELGDALERALGKLGELEMPVGSPKPAPESPPDHQQITKGSPTDHQPAPEAPPAAPPPPVWGPAQAKALQEIVQSNAQMEAQLKALAEERDRYRQLVERAQQGDVLGFAEEAKIPESELLESLQAGGKPLPATRPYVRRLEATVQELAAKMSAMEKAAAEREQRTVAEREIADITQQLQAKPEYGILRQIPDAAVRVQALMREQELAARNRGEVPSVTADQAASLLKAQLVESLKRILTADDVRRELGLGDPATPDSAPPKPKKAITAKMSSQGSIQNTTGYSPDDQLRRALRKMMG